MTKAQIKYFQSLSRQKYRNAYKVYLVEGDKSATEWLRSDEKIIYIAAVDEWINRHPQLIARHPEAEVIVVQAFEMEKISLLKSAPEVILVAGRRPEPESMPPPSQWSLYLDQIQDPGNMGTLIRIADWFGMPDIICSDHCVEVYNPKVVQASMGSLLRSRFYILSEEALIDFAQTTATPLYAGCLDGENLFEISRDPVPGILIVGNESKGVSQRLQQAADKRLTIPRFGGAESLNVAVATGILTAMLRAKKSAE